MRVRGHRCAQATASEARVRRLIAHRLRHRARLSHRRARPGRLGTRAPPGRRRAAVCRTRSCPRLRRLALATPKACARQRLASIPPVPTLRGRESVRVWGPGRRAYESGRARGGRFHHGKRRMCRRRRAVAGVPSGAESPERRATVRPATRGLAGTCARPAAVRQRDHRY